MSAESRRHLTHRRTRFRSSTNNELGTVADEVDVAQHIYPNKLPSEPKLAAAKIKTITVRPAGFIGLGCAMLFMGLHQCICTPANGPSRQHRRGSQTLLLLTTLSAAAQFIAGVRDRARADGGVFALFFHGAQSLVWTTMALQLQLLAPAAHLLGPDGIAGRQQQQLHAGCRALSVAVSMVLMAAAFSCVACAVFARAARVPIQLLLAGEGLGLLCLSRAEFQRPHDAVEAAGMNGYGGGFLVVASFLAFRIAWHALGRRSACVIRVTPDRDKS
ncbi:hypothetical protein PWT90_07938 [Aphanocladium album]|nr:hypothetical protein PWT90_07938 [Aphanocladium album]